MKIIKGNLRLMRENMTSDDKLIVAFCSVLFYPNTASFVNSITNIFLPAGFYLDTLLVFLLHFILVVQSIKVVISRFKYDMILIVFIIMFSVILGVLRYSYQLEFYFDLLFKMISSGVLLYFLIRCIKDFSRLEESLIKLSYFVIVFGLVEFLIVLTTRIYEIQYMVFSYKLIISVMLLYYEYRDKKNKMSLLFSFIGLFLIFISGSRGAIITILSYILLEEIFSKRERINSRSFMKIGVFVLMTFMLYSVNITKVLVEVNSFLISQDINSRTIQKIIENTFFDSSGRNEISGILLNSIMENPYGYGIGGDTMILSNYYSALPQGLYSHNILIQVVIEYGIPIGILLILTSVSLLTNVILNERDKHLRNLVFIFISSSLIKLLFTGNYLYESNFFILAGLVMSSNLRVGIIKKI